MTATWGHIGLYTWMIGTVPQIFRILLQPVVASSRQVDLLVQSIMTDVGDG